MSSLGVADYTALWDSQNYQPANLLLQSSFSFEHPNVAGLTKYAL